MITKKGGRKHQAIYENVVIMGDNTSGTPVNQQYFNDPKQSNSAKMPPRAVRHLPQNPTETSQLGRLQAQQAQLIQGHVQQSFEQNIL